MKMMVAAVEADPAHGHVQQQRQPEGDNELERHRDERIQGAVADRLPERWILGEHGLVVVEPDPGRRLDDVVLGEREVQGGQHRVCREDEQGDEPRQNEKETGSRLLPPERADRRTSHGNRRHRLCSRRGTPGKTTPASTTGF
jgi:hypothetical protein